MKEINEQKKNNKIALVVIVVLLSAAAVYAGLAYWRYTQARVYIEKSEAVATPTDLSPNVGGTLNEVMVNVGDEISENSVVARVGDELIKSKSSGIVTYVKDDIGKTVNHGETVVSMVDLKELRIVGHLDEDKGLKDVKIGQKAIFTIDAFGSKKFVGVVDEISEVSRSTSVVFSISDKRETKQFDIKVRFDLDQYPEIKNGMSAKVWVYKD